MSQPWGQPVPPGNRPGPQWGPQPPVPPGYPGGPQGYYPYGPPPRRRNPLPWVLAGLAAVVVAVTIVLVVVLTSGDSDAGKNHVAVDRSTVRGTAQAMLDGLMNRDPYTINDVSCQKASDEQVE